MKYRQLHTDKIVEAIQWKHTNTRELAKKIFSSSFIEVTDHKDILKEPGASPSGCLRLYLEDDYLEVFVDDWVIKGPKGISICRPYTFDSAYKSMEEE